MKNKKTLLIAGLVSLGVIILSVGLGVGLGLDDHDHNDNTHIEDNHNNNEGDEHSHGSGEGEHTHGGETDNNNGNNDNHNGEGGSTHNPDDHTHEVDQGDKEPVTPVPPTPTKDTDRWEVITEIDPIDSTKEFKTLRVKKDTTLEQFKTIKTKLINEGIDVNTMNEIHVPYSFKKQLSVGKLAEALDLPSDYDNNKIGFILNADDYDPKVAAANDNSINYQNNNIVEVNLDPSITSIPDNAFSNNKIKKVNFEELINLETLGKNVFNNNSLEKDLDLSKLTKLKIIKIATFANNRLKGRIVLPPNIEEINDYSFNFEDNHSGHIKNNKLTGELKFPSSLKKIENFAFAYNNLTKIDWSEAENLERIGIAAFTQNKISGLDFDNFPPNLSFIDNYAFDKTVDKSIKSDITLSPKLLHIGIRVFEVVDNITITISPNATSIRTSAFIGTGIKIVKGTSV